MNGDSAKARYNEQCCFTPGIIDAVVFIYCKLHGSLEIFVFCQSLLATSRVALQLIEHLHRPLQEQEGLELAYSLPWLVSFEVCTVVFL